MSWMLRERAVACSAARSFALWLVVHRTATGVEDATPSVSEQVARRWLGRPSFYSGTERDISAVRQKKIEKLSVGTSDVDRMRPSAPRHLVSGAKTPSAHPNHSGLTCRC